MIRSRLSSPYSQLIAFTLIEVLIALAIVTIALTAVLTAVSHHIRQLDYLNTRSLAHLAALNAISEVQVGLIKPPLAPYFDQRKTIILQRPLYLRISLAKSATPHVNSITVAVRTQPDGEVIHQLTGYQEAA